jgi:hypothetical protein
LKHVSSSLCVLELGIAQEQLPKLFSALQNVQYLHDLSLRVPILFTSGGLQGNRWKAPTLPGIRKFTLEIIIEELIDGLTLEASFAEAAHPVLDALDKSFPKVRSLHLESYIYGNDLVRLVETMDDLITLDLISVVRSDQTRKATCPTLRTLRAEYENVLHYLSMPNLTSVELVRLTVGDEEMENELLDCSFVRGLRSAIMHAQLASTILANGGEFTQLLKLEWYNCRHGYNYRDDFLPSLKEIIFSYSDAPQSGTAFCESLLRYPRSCPRLETIGFQRYPEWDMLFYMLLRRNVHLIQTSISRILRIQLSMAPAPFILVPLSTLLLGKIPVEMPSPEELSFMEIQDVYFDQTMYVSSIREWILY